MLTTILFLAAVSAFGIFLVCRLGCPAPLARLFRAALIAPLMVLLALPALARRLAPLASSTRSCRSSWSFWPSSAQVQIACWPRIAGEAHMSPNSKVSHFAVWSYQDSATFRADTFV